MADTPWMHGTRRWIVLPLVAAMALFGMGAASADSATEGEFLAKINAARSENGLGLLQIDDGLEAHARSHTEGMIDAAELYHSTSAELGAAGGQGWDRIGENVGRGQTPTSLHDAFMKSPAHRDNVLGDYNYVGIGTRSSDGYLYATVVFMKKGTSPTVDDASVAIASSPCPEGAVCDTAAFQDPDGRFDLWDELASTRRVSAFYYGNPGDVAFAGDWDCDGVETLGLYRRSDGYVYLSNANTEGLADITYYFGNPGDFPIAGDFDGDGCDTVSIHRPSEARFYIINSLGAADRGLGSAHHSFIFGMEGDKTFVHDFDGDGVDTVGLHREGAGLVYFRNSHSSGLADGQFTFGDSGDILVAGDWDGDGDDTVGVYRPSTGMFYANNSNTGATADAALFVGSYSGVVALRP